MIVVTLCVLALILGLGFGLTYRNKNEINEGLNNNIDKVVTLSDEVLHTSPKSTLKTSENPTNNGGTYANAAVASDGKPCAKIGV